MTIHSAKGLEFNYVFLPCWYENEVPKISYKIEDGKEVEDKEILEEERRIAFVGFTRARQRVYISYS